MEGEKLEVGTQVYEEKPDGLGFGRPGALKDTGFMHRNIQKCQHLQKKTMLNLTLFL